MRIAIIGAGAAGCFAGANIPYKEGREVVIFEKSNKALQKVKVSGGGRCNVTHDCHDIPVLIDKYPRGKRFLKKTLYQFPPQKTIDWFKERGVELKVESDGRIFPTSDSSQTIINCLHDQLQKNKVKVEYSKAVTSIKPENGTCIITFSDKYTYVADKVLISCGGFPKTEQYRWLLDIGHNIEQPVPSLFTFNIPKHPITELMGISVEHVTVRFQGSKIKESGPILITHWGLSGPVTLRCSAWGAKELSDRNYDFNIFINWLDDISEEALKDSLISIRQYNGKQLVANKNPFGLPKRLWEYIITSCDVNADVKWGDLPAAAQNKLIKKLVNDEYRVSGKTTFKEEFVTCGGVKLSEINPQTLESRVVAGLYFAGEILNVDGITGGFNFQHAWSSSYIAAKHMIDR